MLKVPGKRRISTVSGRAVIGEFWRVMLLLMRNWSRRLGWLPRPGPQMRWSVVCGCLTAPSKPVRGPDAMLTL